MGHAFTKTEIVDGSTLTGAAISTAIGNLSGNGGVVIVEQGTYIISSTISIPSNVTLIGRGNVVLNVRCGAPAFTNANGAGGDERITISGFKIIVQHENLYGGDDNDQYSLIDLKCITGCIIEKINVVYDEYYEDAQGIYVPSDGTDVEKASAAISISGTTTDVSENNIIRYCFIKNYGMVSGVDIKYGVGIKLVANCKSNHIYMNYVNGAGRGCTLDNIKVNSIYYDNYHNTISNNVFINSKNGTNLLVGASHFTTTTGNICNECATSHGIYPSSSEACSYSSNICCENQKEGIKPAWAATYYNTISGNCCINNISMGIHINNQATSAINHYMAIFGNACCENVNNGIKMDQYAEYVNIIGNMCYENDTTNNKDIRDLGSNNEIEDNIGTVSTT